VDVNLRERKRQAARAALSEAAQRLALERGWENVRVEDIAADVGMSTRSFSNYFGSKEEAFFAINLDRPSQVREALRVRPAGEPLWDAVINATLMPFDLGREPDRSLVSYVQLASSTPRMHAEYLRSHSSLEQALAEGIAERLDVDINDQLLPRMMAGVVVAALRIAIDHWLNTDPGALFVPTLRHALEEVSRGLPEPETSAS
jgi:AcrR family transcriptional regulator